MNDGLEDGVLEGLLDLRLDGRSVRLVGPADGESVGGTSIVLIESHTSMISQEMSGNRSVQQSAPVVNR